MTTGAETVLCTIISPAYACLPTETSQWQSCTMTSTVTRVLTSVSCAVLRVDKPNVKDLMVASDKENACMQHHKTHA